MSSKSLINIIGAGLVGSLYSIYMARKGYKVVMYERRADMRSFNSNAGRSINLALSDRGFKGLKGVGIDDEIRKIGIPMKGRVMHDIEGNLTFQPYGKEGQSIYSVSRKDLNCKLMDLAEKEGVKIYFEHKCTSVNLDHAQASFQHLDNTVQIEGDLLVGTDGAYSEVRDAMQKTAWFNYSQYYIDYAYKELSIPSNADGTHKLEKNALHIWPRKDFMLIALPNIDGSFTCTLFFPKSGELSFESLNSSEKAEDFFKTYFFDAFNLMPNFKDEFLLNPAAGMVIVKCYPWTWKDKAMLIGDAAHAIVPFYGQGMNCGFEDCSIFSELHDLNSNDWSALLKDYENSRKENADAIAELALRNFIEMRDKVADPIFLLQKKIEAKFSNSYPQFWTPLYSMVTFSDIPYSDALKMGEKQESIMQTIMQKQDIAEIWDSEEVEKEMLNYFIR
jgi:kynurenine 3-monooxygenase